MAADAPRKAIREWVKHWRRWVVDKRASDNQATSKEQIWEALNTFPLSMCHDSVEQLENIMVP